MKKRLFVGMLAGAAILSGSIAFYLSDGAAANAKEFDGDGLCGAYCVDGQACVRMDSDEASKRVAETFGVDADEVQKSIEAGTNFQSVGQAALLAKISGKSYADVAAMKTSMVSWQSVREKLGITEEQMRSVHCAMGAKNLAYMMAISEADALEMLEKGYRVRDISAAVILAKETGKDMQDILDYKKINNRWADVARELGVDPKLVYKNRTRNRFGKSMGTQCNCPVYPYCFAVEDENTN